MVILLVNRRVPLKRRGCVYEMCVRPVMLYGVETWTMMEGIEILEEDQLEDQGEHGEEHCNRKRKFCEQRND